MPMVVDPPPINLDWGEMGSPADIKFSPSDTALIQTFSANVENAVNNVPVLSDAINHWIQKAGYANINEAITAAFNAASMTCYCDFQAVGSCAGAVVASGSKINEVQHHFSDGPPGLVVIDPVWFAAEQAVQKCVCSGYGSTDTTEGSRITRSFFIDWYVGLVYDGKSYLKSKWARTKIVVGAPKTACCPDTTTFVSHFKTVSAPAKSESQSGH